MDTLLELLGLLLIAAGAATYHPGAGLIVAGIGLVLIGYLMER